MRGFGTDKGGGGPKSQIFSRRHLCTAPGALLGGRKDGQHKKFAVQKWQIKKLLKVATSRPCPTTLPYPDLLTCAICKIMAFYVTILQGDIRQALQ